jgi:titin
VQVTGVPDAPTAVAGSGASATSATITFTPSAVTPYAAITSYKFDYSAGPSYSSWSTVATTGAGTATTFTITGLTGATNYKVRVYAVNSSGTSAASVASAAFSTYAAAAITGTPSVTGSVTVGSTLTADETSLVVTGTPTATLTRSWYACDNTTDALTLTGSCAAISGETTATLALTGSQSMKYIVYRVVATNSSGSAAAISSATTQVPGVPGAPTGVSMTALSTTSLRVDYTLPTDIGGGALTGIQYQISVAPYSAWSAYTSASDMSGSFTVSGLTAGTSYKVILRAVNAIGNGVATAASAAVSTFGAPTVAIAPTLAGTAHVGQTLSATEPAGMFAGNPAPSVASRAWYACASTKAAGESLADCSSIAGATGTSLTIASAQVGTYIVFTATGTNTEGSVTAGSAS